MNSNDASTIVHVGEGIFSDTDPGVISTFALLSDDPEIKAEVRKLVAANSEIIFDFLYQPHDGKPGVGEAVCDLLPENYCYVWLWKNTRGKPSLMKTAASETYADNDKRNFIPGFGGRWIPMGEGVFKVRDVGSKYAVDRTQRRIDEVKRAQSSPVKVELEHLGERFVEVCEQARAFRANGDATELQIDALISQLSATKARLDHIKEMISDIESLRELAELSVVGFDV